VLDRVLGAHLPHGRPTIAEVGCGTGGNLPMLARHGEAVGLDSAPFAVDMARQNTGLPVWAATLPGPLPDGVGPFDAVCLFDVLEHIEDDGAALDSVAGMIHPGGLLFVTVPALPWLWSRHDVAFGHHRRYLQGPLLALLRDHGFEVLHSSYFCSLLLPAIVAIRQVNRLMGVEGGQDFDIPAAGMNLALRKVFSAEAGWVARGSLPLGSSLLAVARR